MRTSVALVLTLLSATPLLGQERVHTDVIDRIRAEGLERSQVLELYGHLTNVIGPRLTATPAYRQAADWAAAKFQAWGLANPHLESFEFGRGWTLEKLTLELTEPRYFPLIGYPEAWTPSTRGVIEGVPVYVGDKTADQVLAIADQLRGRILLTLPPQENFIRADRQQPADTDQRVPIGAPRNAPNRGTLTNNELRSVPQQVGAAAALRPNQGEHGTVFVLGQRNTRDDATPQVVLAAEHYNMIVRMLQSGAAPRLRIEVRARYHEEDTNGYNVIAEIPGTDPAVAGEIVLLGAHLDSWHSSNGATDNADGSAEVMEAMRILTAIGARPRRTIRVALWGGEEQGLLGARAHAERHYAGDANAAAREKFYVYLNDDPGTGKIYGWYLQENAAIAPIFDAWLAPLRDLGAKKNVIDEIGSTDHLAFTRLGMLGFNTIKDYADYDVRTHHTNTDFFERVSETDLKQSAIVLAVFAYHAAMKQGPLPR